MSMECACEIDLCHDSDHPDFFKINKNIAKKEHQCCECRRTIKIGEDYICEVGCWDGRFDRYKTCNDCISIRDAYFCSFIYGELESGMRDFIYENRGEILNSLILDLTPAARNMVFGWIEDYWDEDDDNNNEGEDG